MSADKRVSTARLRDPLTWALLAAFALASFLYYPLFFPETPETLIAQGEDFFFEANEAAGGPVLLLTLWLLYRRSHYLDLLQRPGAPIVAAFCFAIAIIVYGWGAYTQAPDLQLVSIVGMLAGSVLLSGGRAGWRAFWVPILFLVFALPIPPVPLSAVMYSVQLATAQYAGVILNAIGVASFVQGDQILRPENSFVVIETCSGVRTVVTLTMLTVLLIDLFERRGRHAALLILLAPIIAFLTNGLRVVTLVLNPYSDIVSIHNLQGIAMLLIGLTAIYLIDGLIERVLGDEVEGEGNGQEDDDTAGAAQDELEVFHEDGVARAVSARRIAVVGAVMASMLAIGHFATPWSFERYVDEKAGDVLVRAFDDWPSEKLAPDYNFLGSVRFLTWEDRRVRVDGHAIDVFLGVGDEQRREQTILTPRLAWPASGYAVIDDEYVPVTSLGESEWTPSDQDVRRLVLRRGAKMVVSYSWYARAESLPVEWIRQAAALDRSPFVRPEHILAVRISANLGSHGSQREAVEARIRKVYERLEPALESFAPTVAPVGHEMQGE
jgi:exosortase